VKSANKRLESGAAGGVQQVGYILARRASARVPRVQCHSIPLYLEVASLLTLVEHIARKESIPCNGLM